MLELILTRTRPPLGDNNINILGVPRPYRSREYNDIGHYNAFSQILVENMPFSSFAILNEVSNVKFLLVSLAWWG
jgi:hypothetical protein